MGVVLVAGDDTGTIGIRACHYKWIIPRWWVCVGARVNGERSWETEEQIGTGYPGRKGNLWGSSMR